MTDVAAMVAERFQVPRETTTVPRGTTAPPPAGIDALLAAGCTRRQADHWTRKGWVRAERRAPGRGSGYPRTYPPAEVWVAATMARLVAAGLTPEAAHRVARGRDVLAPGIRVEVRPL